MLKKIILTYNLIIVTLIVIIGALFAGSTDQAAIALLFLPIAVVFGRELFLDMMNLNTNHPGLPLGEPSDSLPVTAGLASAEYEDYEEGIIEPEELTDAEVSDINKRLFLKLIGSAGLSMFVFSLFTKKTHAAFFGSMPGPGIINIKDSAGDVIDPAEKEPTDGYEIADVDDDTIPAYYGFIDKDGNWYITKEDTNGGFRYVRGTTNYVNNWTNRDLLTYDHFNNVF